MKESDMQLTFAHLAVLIAADAAKKVRYGAARHI